MMRKKIFYLICLCNLFLFNNALNSCKAEEMEPKYIEQLFYSYADKIESKNYSQAEREQIIVDTYYPYFNFEWFAKMSLGRPYKTLTPQQQNEYINEMSKFFSYVYLPFFDYDRKIGILLKIEPKTIKINDTDSIVKIVLTAPDSKKYNIDIRVRKTNDKRKINVLNMTVDGIDLAMSYRAQFTSYVEEHNNDATSIIKFLKDKNAQYSKTSKVVFKNLK